jgi:hypothetical protein
MGTRITSKWRELSTSEVAGVGGYLGVYEVRALDGEYLRIGYAGGRSRYGLRGELERLLGRYGADAALMRIEITSSYLSRYQELLAVHLHDHGRMPRDNDNDPSRIGVVTPD